MKTVRNACRLQPKALEITVADQIEQLDQVIRQTDGREHFAKTCITEGMQTLLTRGLARLAGKSNDSVFHLKQAMGGGKTHLMVCFGLLAQDKALRQELIPLMPHQADFDAAHVVAFNGRNRPDHYFWGEIARQLGQAELFKTYWTGGPKAPDEKAWLELFGAAEDRPILVLLDELPPYFHYYNTQNLGRGTVADVVTNAFSNLLTAAQKKRNVCVVVSDLHAAYRSGGDLIQAALQDARQEIGRAEVAVTPVNLESNEVYEILRKRLFSELPGPAEIADIADAYAQKLAEAARAKTVRRSAEALAGDIEATYPFHPGFKHIVALFKENEKFKQTRGLMELVSRLLKSVWESKEEIFLIGAQHFDLSIPEVREKLAEISEMRDVIAKDLWDTNGSAHAQVIDSDQGGPYARQAGTLLLLSSLSTAVNSVKGLTEEELLENLIDPLRRASDFRPGFTKLLQSAWYLHQTQEGRAYFDRQENLTKKLQSYADKAPQNQVDDLVRHTLTEMFKPASKEAYEKALPLPEMDTAEAELKSGRALLIISPDGKTPPSVVAAFFQKLVNKNNILILTGEKSDMVSVERAARHVWAAGKADKEIVASHPQRRELDEKKAQYEQDFQTTILGVLDTLYYPRFKPGVGDVLAAKPLDGTYSVGEPYSGERQIIKSLTADPIKLYTDIAQHFDGLRERAEKYLFGGQESMPRAELLNRMRQQTRMPWLPARGLDALIVQACQNGYWEDMGNGYISRTPRPKETQVIVHAETEPDDAGAVRLKIETANAGDKPVIHYAVDNEVSEDSPVLNDNTLLTDALRVRFLAVDPTGQYRTGQANVWTNSLTIRNRFDEKTRLLTLLVAPRGALRYTLDGSEARNGLPYTEPIQLGPQDVTVHVFAECEGLEAKRAFTFGGAGDAGPKLDRAKPAMLTCPQWKHLDNAQKIYEALKIARERGMDFEQVQLLVGSVPRIVNLSLGEIRVGADFIDKELERLRELVGPEAPLILKFKKLHCHSGLDLEHFVEKTGIVLNNGEVEQ